MKKIVLFQWLVLMAVVSWAQPSISAYHKLIPAPQNVDLKAGDAFVLSEQCAIAYPKNNSKLQQTAEFLAEYLYWATGLKIRLTDEVNVANSIQLSEGLAHSNPEAYQMLVDAAQIRIKGASAAGTFFGVQSLRKLVALNANDKKVSLSPVAITDYPKFPYRGMMLDVSRHFAPVSFVKKYLDLMALHHFNTFHWHLTDDQGWRIEIKKYPKLTEIGSKRKGTVIGKTKTQIDPTPHEGYYTQEEIREIVTYAQQRFITVIPEIDLPGHMMAAIASYPELGCQGSGYEVRTTWGVSEDVLCVGNENTFTFIENVLNEMLPLFPATYYHIGGDECPKKQWQKCPKCQNKINALGLVKDQHHSAEEKLQSYTISRVEKFLNNKGKKIIGWDEILEGGLAPNATVMSWRGFEGGIQAAQQGHDVVMTPGSHVYFDHYQTKDITHEPLAIGGFTSLEKVYLFDPIPNILKEEERKHILGAQGNVWREYMPTSKQVEYMVLPRMAALSEVLWTYPQSRGYKKFAQKAADYLPFYHKLGYNFSRHFLEIGASTSIDTPRNAITLTLATPLSYPIYYTTDGTMPTTTSPVYTQPLVITQSQTIKAVILDDVFKSKVFEQSFAFNKATVKPITLQQAPAEKYKYQGASVLNDGKVGDQQYASGEWLGFYNQNFEAVVDLQQPQKITQVKLNTYISPKDWIFGPKEWSVLVSKDGQNYKEVYRQSFVTADANGTTFILPLKADFKRTTAQYVKIVAPIVTKIPEGHAGAGQPTFIFVDEIQVE